MYICWWIQVKGSSTWHWFYARLLDFQDLTSMESWTGAEIVIFDGINIFEHKSSNQFSIATDDNKNWRHQIYYIINRYGRTRTSKTHQHRTEDCTLPSCISHLSISAIFYLSLRQSQINNFYIVEIHLQKVKSNQIVGYEYNNQT